MTSFFELVYRYQTAGNLEYFNYSSQFKHMFMVKQTRTIYFDH